MQVEQLFTLLEKMESRKYILALRHVSKNNKRIKFAGFSSIEKVPMQIIASTAKTKDEFRKLLLSAVETVILEGTEVDETKPLVEIKMNIPRELWLGVAARLMLSDEEASWSSAYELIMEYSNVVTAETVQTEERIPEKQGKKEGKFREKYMKAQSDISRLKEELELQRTLVQREKEATTKALEEVRKMLLLQSEATAQIEELKKIIEQISKEKEQLQHEVSEQREASEQIQKMYSSKGQKTIYAPSCKDLLEKYSDYISIQFDAASTESIKNGVEKYDETWMFTKILPFGVVRILEKLKKTGNYTILIFDTADELINHAEMIVQN